MILASIQQAVQLIQATPGYAKTGVELAQMASENRIRVNLDLDDRAHAGLMGAITLGPEAANSSFLSLAQTLVHEHFHLQQNPLLKTASFWSGVATRTSPMLRYEKPAYQAAFQFLEAIKKVRPALADEAESEQAAIRQVFFDGFNEDLI